MNIRALSAQEIREVEEQWDALFSLYEHLIDGQPFNEALLRVIEVRKSLRLADADEIEFAEREKSRA